MCVCVLSQYGLDEKKGNMHLHHTAVNYYYHLNNSNNYTNVIIIIIITTIANKLIITINLVLREES